MITLETGIPGSGKTLYCVDKLIRPLLNAKIKHEGDDGVVRELPRRVFSNINGLLLEHSKIDPGASWLYDGKTDKWTQDPKGNKLGLNNWHEWAKPGDVIIYDEVQKVWPLAATGSKVPPCIEALETHRHMGVDFIVMTQHPMMIAANLTRLTGRHLHMRRLGNAGFATVYEWDGCSRTLLYKNCMAKFPYWYGKKAFDLYKSAEVHTKSARKLPSLIFGIIFAGLAITFIGPSALARIADRINPPPKVESPANAVKPASTAPAAPHPAPAASQPAAPVAQAAQAQAVGCIASAARCACYDAAGMIVPAEEAICRAGSKTQGMTILAQPPSFQMSTVYQPQH